MGKEQIEVKVTKKTIDKVGITQDYRKAICEYIWNGFDAGATRIDINYEVIPNTNHITSFSITDNGSGIDYNTLDFTFTPMLDSQKDIGKKNSSYIKGKKGKGRFSFISFCSFVQWNTVYKKGDNNIHYKIDTSIGNKNKYEISERKGTSKDTGTQVIFSGFDVINGDVLGSKDFIDYLKQEFAWFLQLNKSDGYVVRINKMDLDYASIISESFQEKVNIEDSQEKKEYDFEINYIEWNKKIGNYSQNYFSNSERRPIWEKDTGFNKKGDGFFHSVYIVSDYFDNFQVVQKGNILETDLFGSHTNKNKVFKQLEKELKVFLAKMKKAFLKKNAERLIEKLYEENIMPDFGQGVFERYKKEDFELVVKEIYIFEPQLFEQKSNKQQKRTILEFLKLLLDENKREKIIDVIGRIIELSDEELDEFRDILTHTDIAHISRLVNFIIDRKKVILGLEKLVFDLKKFTNERDHIQKVIESNYWLFGEQYNLVSADKNFKKLEEEYLKIFHESQTETTLETNMRRPDIFMVRNRKIPANNKKYDKIEHIMVELKRPSQKIGKDQYRQIEDYMEIIKKSPSLNGKLDTWKFYVVGNDLDDFVTDRYKQFEDQDDPFLVHESIGKYRIYALTWQELFTMFSNTHQHLIDELDIQDEKLIQELNINKISFSKEGSTEIVEKISHSTKGS